MKVRATVTVKGRVNGVGYREIVDERAFPLELTGYVRELAEGCMEVVCEGEQEVVQAFIKRISVVKYPVRVTGVEVRYSEAAGDFADFRVLRDGGPLSELGERLESALRCARDIQAELATQQDGREMLSRILVVQHKALERLDRALRVQVKLLDNQERALKKRDATVATMRGLDRRATERAVKLGRRQDRMASTMTAIARDVNAIRRNGAKRKGRRRNASGRSGEPAPAAAPEGPGIRPVEQAQDGIHGGMAG